MEWSVRDERYEPGPRRVNNPFDGVVTLLVKLDRNVPEKSSVVRSARLFVSAFTPA